MVFINNQKYQKPPGKNLNIYIQLPPNNLKWYWSFVCWLFFWSRKNFKIPTDRRKSFRVNQKINSLRICVCVCVEVSALILRQSRVKTLYLNFYELREWNSNEIKDANGIAGECEIDLGMIFWMYTENRERWRGAMAVKPQTEKSTRRPQLTLDDKKVSSRLLLVEWSRALLWQHCIKKLLPAHHPLFFITPANAHPKLLVLRNGFCARNKVDKRCFNKTVNSLLNA